MIQEPDEVLMIVGIGVLGKGANNYNTINMLGGLPIVHLS